MMIDYMGPSLDTPSFWHLQRSVAVRKLPRSVGSSMQRSVADTRCQSTRSCGGKRRFKVFRAYVARDYDLDGVCCRKARGRSFLWTPPSRSPKFPIPMLRYPRDNAGRHMAFGAGPHRCLA